MEGWRYFQKMIKKKFLKFILVTYSLMHKEFLFKFWSEKLITKLFSLKNFSTR